MPFSIGDRVKIKTDPDEKLWFVIDRYKFSLNGYAYGLTDFTGRRLFWIAEEQITLASMIIGDDELEAWFKL